MEHGGSSWWSRLQINVHTYGAMVGTREVVFGRKRMIEKFSSLALISYMVCYIVWVGKYPQVKRLNVVECGVVMVGYPIGVV